MIANEKDERRRDKKKMNNGYPIQEYSTSTQP